MPTHLMHQTISNSYADADISWQEERDENVLESYGGRGNHRHHHHHHHPTPTPHPKTPTPHPKTPTPHPKTPTPHPKTPTPHHKTPTPHHKTPTPHPHHKTPTPHPHHERHHKRHKPHPKTPTPRPYLYNVKPSSEMPLMPHDQGPFGGGGGGGESQGPFGGPFGGGGVGGGGGSQGPFGGPFGGGSGSQGPFGGPFGGGGGGGESQGPFGGPFGGGGESQGPFGGPFGGGSGSQGPFGGPFGGGGESQGPFGGLFGGGSGSQGPFGGPFGGGSGSQGPFGGPFGGGGESQGPFGGHFGGGSQGPFGGPFGGGGGGGQGPFSKFGAGQPSVVNQVSSSMPPSNAPNFVINGLFSTEALSTNSYKYNANVSGWTFNAVLVNTSSAWGFVVPYPLQAMQCAAIQNNPSQNSNMLQTINMPQGTFTISFYYTGRPGGANNVDVFFTTPTGSNVSIVSLASSSTSTSQWSLFQSQFTIPSAGLYTLNFKGKGNSSNSDVTTAFTGVMIQFASANQGFTSMPPSMPPSLPPSMPPPSMPPSMPPSLPPSMPPPSMPPSLPPSSMPPSSMPPSLPPSNAPNFVINGLFSTEALSTNSYKYNANVSGWTFNAVLVNTSSAWGFVVPYPLQTMQCAAIQNNSSQNSNMLQTINMPQGTFTISFYYTGRPGGANNVDIFFTTPTGSNVSIVSLASSSTSTSQWSLFQSQFTIPSAGLYTLNFKGKGNSSNSDVTTAFTGVMIQFASANQGFTSMPPSLPPSSMPPSMRPSSMPPSNAPNFVINGLFSTEALSTNTYKYNANVSGWTFNAVLVNTSSAWGFVVPYPLQAMQCAAIQNSPSQNSNMLQTINMPQGTFTISFYYTGRPGGANNVDVFFTTPTGSTVSIVSLSSSTTSTSKWSLFQSQFTIPSAGLYTLNFKGKGNSSNSDVTTAFTGVMIQ